MTNVLLIVLIILIVFDIGLKNIKAIRKPKPDKKAIEKAKQKKREFENFMSYSGDEQH